MNIRSFSISELALIRKFSTIALIIILLLVNSPIFSQDVFKPSQKYYPVQNSFDIGNNDKLTELAVSDSSIFGLSSSGEVFQFENNQWVKILPYPNLSYTSIACNHTTLFFSGVSQEQYGKKLVLKKYKNNNWEEMGSIYNRDAEYYAQKTYLINKNESVYLAVQQMGGVSIFQLYESTGIQLGDGLKQIFLEHFYCSGSIPVIKYRYSNSDNKSAYATAIYDGSKWIKTINENGDLKSYISVNNNTIHSLFSYPKKDFSDSNYEFILANYIKNSWNGNVYFEWKGVKRDTLQLPNTFYTITYDSVKMHITYFEEPFNGNTATKYIYYNNLDKIKDSLKIQSKKIENSKLTPQELRNKNAVKKSTTGRKAFLAQNGIKIDSESHVIFDDKKSIDNSSPNTLDWKTNIIKMNTILSKVHTETDYNYIVNYNPTTDSLTLQNISLCDLNSTLIGNFYKAKLSDLFCHNLDNEDENLGTIVTLEVKMEVGKNNPYAWDQIYDINLGYTMLITFYVGNVQDATEFVQLFKELATMMSPK